MIEAIHQLAHNIHFGVRYVVDIEEWTIKGSDEILTYYNVRDIITDVVMKQFDDEYKANNYCNKLNYGRWKAV